MIALRTRTRRAGPFVAALLGGVVIAGSVPLAAASFDATNADKVDGRHAVGAGASAAARAGKLVATNSVGRLPNAIIARAPNSALLGGLGPAAYQRRIAASCGSAEVMTAVAIGTVTCAPDALDGGNAQTLDGKAAAEIAANGQRTVFVRRVGTAAENGTALLNAVAGIPTTGDSAPAENNPWIIMVEPGRFDLDERHLIVPSYVTLQGAGPTTQIMSAGGGSNPVTQAAVVMLTRSGLRSVRLRTDSSGGAAGVYLAGPDTFIEDVPITVSGLPAYGIVNGTMSDEPSFFTDINNVDVIVDSATDGFGITVPARIRLRDSRIRLTVQGTSFSAAVSAQSNSDVRDADIMAIGPNTTSLFGIESLFGLSVRDSTVIADGKGTTGIAISGLICCGVSIAHSMIGGAVNDGSPSCIGAYNPAYQPLSATCQ